jgi:hypothetical protein
MKSSLATTLKISVSALALALLSCTASAATSPNAAPFGLEIGVASCDAARTKLGQLEEQKLDGSDLLLTAENPDALYETASKAVVRCSEGKVIAVQIEASKGGMGNEGARAAFASLSKKYKLVSGGPMPELGDGYARFQSGNSIVEQFARHLSFEFTLTYYEKSFYESIVASNKAKQKQAAQKKESSL